MFVRGMWVVSDDDAGTETIASVAVDGGFSIVVGTDTCDTSGAGTVADDNGSAGASC